MLSLPSLRSPQLSPVAVRIKTQKYLLEVFYKFSTKLMVEGFGYNPCTMVLYRRPDRYRFEIIPHRGGKEMFANLLPGIVVSRRNNNENLAVPRSTEPIFGLHLHPTTTGSFG